MNVDKKNKPTIESESESDDDEIESTTDDDSNEEEEEENNDDSDIDEDSIDEDTNIDKKNNDEYKNEEKYEENDNCYAKEISMDDDDVIEFENINDTEKIIKKNGRMTKPFLEKYEVVKLLAIRSKQLAQGAKAMIKDTHDMSHKEIAKEELKLKVMPLILVRPIPNSEPEKWFLRELDYSKIYPML
jgi:DNA-directed RNA polymerase subunit K/omega